MKRSFAHILAVASSCLLLAFCVARCGAEEPGLESLTGQKEFTDDLYGVRFRYPASYDLIAKEGNPSESSTYHVSVGGGPVDGGSKFQSIGVLSIGGWGKGRPDFTALSPGARLRKTRRGILQDPQSVVIGDGKLVKLEQCSVEDDGDGPALTVSYTSKEDGQTQWYYSYATFRNDLLCTIYVWGDPANRAVTNAAVLMTTTFVYDPPQ